MIIKTNILNPVDRDNIEYRQNVFITIENTKITKISEQIEVNQNYEDFSDKICFPGFIDAHVHLSQFYAKGKYEPDLLNWLNKHIFDEESKSANADYAYKISEDFYKDLISHGTTTSVVYTAPFKSACDIAFEVAEKLKVRSIIGMTMMDIDSPESLIQQSENSVNNSIELFKKWNKKTELLEYIFTPRFAPVCSFELMKETGTFAKKNNAYIQTHLSENLNEIEVVKNKFSQFDSYTDVYYQANLLSEKTLLGHCIHLSEKELMILKDTQSKIIHCPDSNFFLKSGEFPMKKVLDAKIGFSLGSDIGAGTCSSMFHHMKMEIYRQENKMINPKNALYDVTLGSAKVLGKENIIGSIAEGKDADIIFFDLGEFTGNTGEEILSGFVFCGNNPKVTNVIIAGEKIY